MQNEKTLPNTEYGKDCRSWGHSCSACPKMIFHDDCEPHDCGFRASDNRVPAAVVDHVDGDASNNEPSNLRIVNPRENLKSPALEHPPLRSLSEVAEQHSPEVQDLISGAAEATDYFTEDELEEYAATKHAPGFTPGPYTYKAVVGLPDEDWWSILADEGRREIAILPRIDADSESNARLFAAATKLYHAAKLALDNGYRHESANQDDGDRLIGMKLREAIDAVEGREA